MLVLLFYRQDNVPLLFQDIQNISAIVVPNSLAVNTNGIVSVLSVDLYYLIYYQEVETVFLDNVALDILQVSNFFSTYIISCEI